MNEVLAIVRKSDLNKANVKIDELKKALSDILGVAYECDNWEQFPQDALDAAQTALDN